MFKTLKTLLFLLNSNVGFVTAGECCEWTKIPITTQKRYLKKAEEFGLVRSDFRPYKSTGKQVFWLTSAGVVYTRNIGELNI
jgi:hypothetical protein